MTNIKLGKSKIMSGAYISEAKSMADFLLSKEHRGPGDTIEAAAYRVQTRFGVPVSTLMRLRHREVKDMLMSNFFALASAYKAATDKMERAYEEERRHAANPQLLRLADFVAGKETQKETSE